MDIRITNQEGNLCISPIGRIDALTALDLETVIKENIEGAKNLTVDCQRLEYISSAGLRVLLFANKQMKGAMKLKNVCQLVMEVFEITGFADILVIE